MSLILYIKDLVVSGKHGVNPHEKLTPQRFSITIELSLVDNIAMSSDKLEDTINWSRLRDDITTIVEQKSYNLVERLANEIAGTVLHDSRVSRVIVTIDKIDAFKSGVPGIRLELDNPVQN